VNNDPNRTDTQERFAACLSVIEPLLAQSGFAQTDSYDGKGSGGPFEAAIYSKGDREFAVSLRFESLMPLYSIGDERELPHAALMKCLLGPAGGNRFPAFADDARQAAEALAYDLEHFCGDFLNGAGTAFSACYAKHHADQTRSGTARLASVEDQLRPK
jgi:hypothetical protein